MIAQNLNAQNETYLTVITVTYNAEKHISHLIKSLDKQSDSNFNWIVQDGCSTDNTLNLLAKAKGINIALESSKDTGIYDAMNKAIKRCSTDYYIVLGADDLLYETAIQDINHALEINQPDLLSFKTCIGNKIAQFSKKPAWLVSPRNHFTAHSVGTVIRTKLHKTIGYYDTNYKIAADTKFLLCCIKSKAIIVKNNAVLGVFNVDGVSSTQKINTHFEHYRALIETGSNPFVQSTLLYLRLLKNGFR